MVFNNLVVITLLGLFPLIVFCDGSIFTELANLKPSQKTALEKFRKAAYQIVTEDYMKTDIFLVKYLQANNFNVRRSTDMLTEALKLRKELKVDEWENPDYFADFERNGDYSIFIDGFDREGRPIVDYFYGDWNVRAAAVSGKIKHLLNYALRGIERANRKNRELNAQGGNNTQFILLLNMEGFNVINQACPACLPLYLGYVSYYEKLWPNTLFRALLINTPDSFETVLKLMRPLMSPATRSALKVFGGNKNEWKPYLDNLIDPTEISDWFDPRGKERRPPSA